MSDRTSSSAPVPSEPGRCPTHGGPMVPNGAGLCLTDMVLNDVRHERAAQFRNYGTNDATPDGSGPLTKWLMPYTYDSASTIEGDLREDYEEYEEGAPVTWVHLLREEMAEAFAEEDPQRLEEELIQVAALAVSWVESLRTRGPLPVVVPCGVCGEAPEDHVDPCAG